MNHTFNYLFSQSFHSFNDLFIRAHKSQAILSTANCKSQKIDPTVLQEWYSEDHSSPFLHQERVEISIRVVGTNYPGCLVAETRNISVNKKMLQGEHLTRRMSPKFLYPKSRDTVPLTDSVFILCMSISQQRLSLKSVRVSCLGFLFLPGCSHPILYTPHTMPQQGDSERDA